MNSMIKANTGIGILSYLDVFPELQRDELIFKLITEKGVRPLTIALAWRQNVRFQEPPS